MYENEYNDIGIPNMEEAQKFRYQVAGLMKSIIRACASEYPKELTGKQYQAWKVQDAIGKEKEKDYELLAKGVRQYKGFCKNYPESMEGEYSVLESIPLPDEDSYDETIHKVFELLNDFFPENFVEKANHYIQKKQSPTKNVWQELVNWNVLDDLRDRLNALPDKQQLDEAKRNQGIAPTDGPNQSGCFHYQGKTYQGMRRGSWELVKRLWDSLNKQIKFQTFRDEFLDDYTEGTSEFKSLQREANHFFRDNNIPYKISKSGELIILKNEKKS